MSKDQHIIYSSLNISSKPWKENNPPQRVLAIRLHALGDVVITLPYLQQLKKSLPLSSKLDLLIREETDDIPRNILLFDKIYSIGGGRNYKKQLLYSTLILPSLFLNRYDVILDLQNNIVSRFIRKSLMPKAWSEFDRFSPIPAGERTRLTIEAAGLGNCFANTNLKLKNADDGMNLLQKNGWDPHNELVILNPAGAFETRNWPINNYASFAKQWLHQFPKTQFIIMGLGAISSKADYLKAQLGDKLINLVNNTAVWQAFAIVQLAKFVLSEDSGIMHMAWVSGIPTLAMFGSTRSDWARPLGKHTFFLDSSDLECGNCMKEFCKYGDTHCLTRYSPEFVFEKAVSLKDHKMNDNR
jgi:heptosyltransferase II